MSRLREALQSCGSDDAQSQAKCVQSVTLCILSFLTLCVCIIQVVRMYRNSGRKFSCPQIALYIAILEMLVGVLHWGFFPGALYVFTIIYLKNLDIATFCYFYCLDALRLFRKQHLFKRVLIPLTIVVLVFFTATLAIAASGVTHMQNECEDPAFLVMSGSGMLIAIAFFIMGIVVARKLSERKMSKTVRAVQNQRLWTLGIWFLVTSFVAVAMDVVYMVVATTQDTCSIAGAQQPFISSMLVLCNHVFDLIVPIWAVLWVFRNEASKVVVKAMTIQPISVEETAREVYFEYRHDEYYDAYEEDEP